MFIDASVDCYSAAMVGELAQWDSLSSFDSVHYWCLSRDSEGVVINCRFRQPRV